MQMNKLTRILEQFPGKDETIVELFVLNDPTEGVKETKHNISAETPFFAVY